MDRLGSWVVIAPARRAGAPGSNPGPGDNVSLKLLKYVICQYNLEYLFLKQNVIFQYYLQSNQYIMFATLQQYFNVFTDKCAHKPRSELVHFHTCSFCTLYADLYMKDQSQVSLCIPKAYVWPHSYTSNKATALLCCSNSICWYSFMFMGITRIKKNLKLEIGVYLTDIRWSDFQPQIFASKAL